LRSFSRQEARQAFKAAHENRLRVQLAKLESAQSPQDMDLPAWRLHPLKGSLKGHWAVSVSGNWRLTFRFVGNDAEVVDYQDDH
jgi:proteic killer suppression protein